MILFCTVPILIYTARSYSGQIETRHFSYKNDRHRRCLIPGIRETRCGHLKLNLLFKFPNTKVFLLTFPKD